MASINATSYSDSIYAYVEGLDTGYAYGDRYCYWYIKNIDDPFSDFTQAGHSTLGARVSSGGGFTYNKLSPNTNYSIYVVISNNGGTPGYTESVYVKLPEQAVKTKPEDTLGVTDSTMVHYLNVYTDRVTLQVSGLDTNYEYSRVCDWYRGGSYVGSTTIAAKYAASQSISISGLSQGSQYTVTARIYRSNNTSNYRDFIRTVSPTSITIECNSQTVESDSFEVCIAGYGAYSYGRKLTWSIGSYEVGTQNLGAGAYNDKKPEWYMIPPENSELELSPDTTYTVDVKILVGSGNDNVEQFYIHPDSIEVTTAKALIQKWTWSKSNGTNTANVQTNLTYIAGVAIGADGGGGRGKLSDFDYRVWNDLVNKVSECVTEAGARWSTTYGTYSTALMASTDKYMTAARFNNVRQNIGLTKPVAVKGYPVYGYYFTDLTDGLNDWIDQLNSSN